MSLKAAVELIDQAPTSNNMLKEVLVGLSKSQKSIDPKFLYDKKGSEIFERICELPEYYPTRAETEIYKNHARDICKLIGPEALIIEPGSGSAEKVRFLLKKLNRPVGYVPVEISREILLRTVEELGDEFPDLRTIPVCADFKENLDLPLSVDSQKGRKIVFFPGSTIGNLDPQEALQFLKKVSKVVGQNGGLLIGVDLKKDKDTIELAYDDPQGVTAAFNLNLLDRLNNEINATFEIDNFNHEAFYNEELGRVEMHLKSKVSQLVRVNETIFRFKEGETIHTENSYKYSTDEFCELCAKARLKIKQCWKDSNKMFCVYFFERE